MDVGLTSLTPGEHTSHRFLALLDSFPDSMYRGTFLAYVFV